jgi:F-type H+-transporting ATPase subunit delta
MAERATVARPYAKAAFAFAQEQGRVREWSGWLSTARDVVRSEDYHRYASSPDVHTGQLVELVAGMCGAGLDAAGRNFLALLAENGRVDYVADVADRFEELRADSENVADVELVSAVELNEAQRERLAAALRTRLKRDVRLHCSVDPALVGGAIVRSGDLLIDGSLQSKLSRLQTDLTA